MGRQEPRTFVGDSVRVFDHAFDDATPYGRGSFCRLAEKADTHDCVVCGVELLEVREEVTTRMRPGAFGLVRQLVDA